MASLPCTSESFIPNIYQGHRQAIYWECAMSADPPQLNPRLLRWEEESPGGTLVPTTLPPAVALAPDYLLRLISVAVVQIHHAKH